MMDGFLDQIEAAIDKQSSRQKKQLKSQLKKNKISKETFKKKSQEIEKWVSGERREIELKRQKVKDTCEDIGGFIQKLETEKKVVLNELNVSNASPNSARSSSVSLPGSSRDYRNAKL